MARSQHTPRNNTSRKDRNGDRSGGGSAHNWAGFEDTGASAPKFSYTAADLAALRAEEAPAQPGEPLTYENIAVVRPFAPEQESFLDRLQLLRRAAANIIQASGSHLEPLPAMHAAGAIILSNSTINLARHKLPALQPIEPADLLSRIAEGQPDFHTELTTAHTDKVLAFHGSPSLKRYAALRLRGYKVTAEARAATKTLETLGGNVAIPAERDPLLLLGATADDNFFHLSLVENLQQAATEIFPEPAVVRLQPSPQLP